MRLSRRSVRVAIVVLGTLLAACGAEPTALSSTHANGAPPSIPPVSVPSVPTVVRVALAYVSGSADTTTWTLDVGGTAQLRATAYDSAGNEVAQPARYRSSNDSVLTVDSLSGVATALVAGEASVSAIVAGVTGSLHTFRVQALVAPALPLGPSIPTTPATPTPATPAPAGPSSPSTVALSIVRFDGQSGPATVSAGVPLLPGALFPGQEGSVHVSVAGVEQPAYVARLSSLHPDGSLRAVLVQFNVDALANGASVAAQLDIGAPRASAMTLAEPLVAPGTAVAGVPLGLPQAAALPTDPNYLIGTDLVGPTLTAAATTALGGAFARYENDFVTFSTKLWATDGSGWAGDYYDRALIYYAMWARTGNPLYWARAGQIAYDYRKNYLELNAYNSTPHWAQLEGLEKHYLLTGDDRSRTAVVMTATKFVGFIPSAYMTTVNGESRIAARVLHSQLLAWRLTPAGSAPVAGATSYNWGANVEATLSKLVAWQSPDGSYPAVGQVCGGQLNYMVGLLDDALIKTYDYYLPTGTSRSAMQGTIRTLVQKSVDYLWTTQWLPAKQSFQYTSVDCTSKSVGSPTPAPDLNNLFSTGFAWTAKQTGDSKYLAAADQIFAGGVAQAYLIGSKQFNESYTNSFRYLGYR